MKTLSIIIPVYKVEQYLQKCVDSIVGALEGQEEDYEVILVDDGSPDNCGSMCDKYAQEYDNIFAFHKLNGGLSDARNFGIEKSKGQYLAFIDSDDWVGPEMKEFIKQVKENAGVDYFQIGFIEVDQNDKVLRTWANKLTGKIMLNAASLRNSRVDVACIKILRRDFLLEYKLFFALGRLHEDFEWSPRLWMSAKTVYFSEINYYRYLINRPGSIMQNYSLKNFSHMLQSANENWGKLINLELNKKYKKMIRRHISGSIIYLAGTRYKKLLKDDCGQFIKEIKKNKHLLSHPDSFNQKIFIFCTKFWGIGNTIKLFALLNR